MATTLAEPQSPAPTRRRPWWHWPLIAAAVFLYALLFGEFFLRLLAPQALVPRYVTAGPEGVRANIAGASFRQWTPEVDVTVRYNDAGQRDDRPALGPRTPGDCRIAVLGDSYFVGFESSYPDSFAARLEEALGKRGHPCRVVNFSVSGFGHAENLRILESRVRPYHPDLLLMSVHQTDGLDNVRSGLYTTGPDGPEPTGKSFLPGIAISDQLNKLALYRWAQENSHLYSALREWAGSMGKRVLAVVRLQAADEGEGNDGGEIVPDSATGDVLPAWVGNPALNAQLVAEIDREGKAMGAPLMLFEIPTTGSRTRYVGVMDRLLPAPLLETIPHASPLARFEQMASPEVQLYLERGHRHWTALGNRVAADVAADAILGQKLLPAPPQ
jgi:hypothetical protein